jgi:hypothetical protein
MNIRAALTTRGILVTAAQIGRSTGTMGPATAAARVLAELLSGVLFPGTALTVLAGHCREVPDDLSGGQAARQAGRSP